VGFIVLLSGFPKKIAVFSGWVQFHQPWQG